MTDNVCEDTMLLGFLIYYSDGDHYTACHWTAKPEWAYLVCNGWVLPSNPEPPWAKEFPLPTPQAPAGVSRLSPSKLSNFFFFSGTGA
jgi:hypothetical protein